MANPNFMPSMSTNDIWRNLDQSRCLTDDLDTIESDITALETSKADVVHTHDGYALTIHEHSLYADIDHHHNNKYALINHTHDGLNSEHTHDEYAPLNHTHSEYALASDVADIQTQIGDTNVSAQISTAIASKADVNHTHTEYAEVNHIHDDYAEENHMHSEYATLTHSHTEYADNDHTHSYSDLEGLPTIPTALPANGGDADTVDGKHASEFAIASDVATLQTLVGDTAVSSQISTATSGILTSANTYTDTKIAALINGAPTTLDTLGEIATAMEENEDVVSALETSIGAKANASDLSAHTGNTSNPHNVTLSQLGVTATTTELNYVDGVTSNIQTQLNGKAASSHGTHVTFTTTTPKAAGTAAVGSATTVSRSDHVHPAQTTVSGNAGSATKLATARTIRTNLASTSTASFDGSANVTPGVTGTLPIANGGTGATSASAAVTKLGISDYVVAQGTSGIWTYRKWNSGVAECWGCSTINYKIDCTTQRANAVYTDDTFKGANASLPSGLFTSVTFGTANARTNGYTIAQVSNLTTTTVSYRVWCPYSTLLASGSVIEFHVKGRWK